jgi:hypothetical protein
MKWKIKVSPKDNDLRTIQRFAWIPIQIRVYQDKSHGLYLVWLEFYQVNQLYKSDKGWTDISMWIDD